ncbi:MAG: IS481 family transposase [Solirubrobacteraceae bacterium]
MLVELSVVEQRYRIVLAVVENRLSVTDVANEHGISRQTLHTWLRRYTAGGLTALVDRRSKPSFCPHQMAPAAEVLLVELRRQYPGWGPTRLHFELAQRGMEPLPGRTSIYRALVRNRLIEPGVQRRRRTEYRRWERSRPMELWQMDVVGFRLADETPAAILSGVDDHSRFCVCAAVMARADSRSVCRGLVTTLQRHGIPDQILTDNGRVFTARYSSFPATVDFDRICHEHGIRHLLAAPYSPTTCGKVERFHRSLRAELLNQRELETLEEAQAAIDGYVHHYNTERPHQSLGMLTPAQRFQYDEAARTLPELEVSTPIPERPQLTAVAVESAEVGDDPFRVTRLIAKQGTVGFAGAVYSIGRRYAGREVTIVAEDDVVRFYLGEVLVKTHPKGNPGTYVKGAATKEVVRRHKLVRSAVS